MMGSFAIIIGVFLIISGGTQYQLFSVSAIVWKPPSTSRLPQSEKHEKVYFSYHQEDFEEAHTISQIKDEEEGEEEEDPYVVAQRMREEEERLRNENEELIIKNADR